MGQFAELADWTSFYTPHTVRNLSAIFYFLVNLGEFSGQIE